ncbi:hypothetical protein YC2023_113279 [Brassica napus]
MCWAHKPNPPPNEQKPSLPPKGAEAQLSSFCFSLLTCSVLRDERDDDRGALSSVLMAEAVQPLTDGAKQFLASRFKDITKLLKEVKALPLAGMEAIESSDDLQIASEDAIYDMSSVLCHGETSTNELSF